KMHAVSCADCRGQTRDSEDGCICSAQPRDSVAALVRVSTRGAGAVSACPPRTGADWVRDVPWGYDAGRHCPAQREAQYGDVFELPSAVQGFGGLRLLSLLNRTAAPGNSRGWWRAALSRI